ncbi:hypothetical protein JOF46_000634 [Paeniglutamicibacter psychrophenolicus]|uniref:Uncharacterized protein n=1 Tax=Paeniglutamicibacter psychrophenolicus TaxID=257454 RepID=A0ABS4W951_9MICC|nr:hypothetical protein [Paeniglutamicibacter psychrophenolicus]
MVETMRNGVGSSGYFGDMPTVGFRGCAWNPTVVFMLPGGRASALAGTGATARTASAGAGG